MRESSLSSGQRLFDLDVHADNDQGGDVSLDVFSVFSISRSLSMPSILLLSRPINTFVWLADYRIYGVLSC